MIDVELGIAVSAGSISNKEGTRRLQSNSLFIFPISSQSTPRQEKKRKKEKKEGRRKEKRAENGPKIPDGL